jgi:hypothetical protein
VWISEPALTFSLMIGISVSWVRSSTTCAITSPSFFDHAEDNSFTFTAASAFGGGEQA